MTTLSSADLARDISVPGIEPVWTCDADGNWRQERRIRLRDGNGWREIRVDAEAIAAWNRRTPSHQALVEALLQASAFILDLNPEAHVGRELVLGAIDAALASVEAKP